MTGKERMLAAFARREPDRVPVWEIAFNEESIIKLGAFYTDDLPPMKFAQQMTMEEKVKLLTTLFTVARELELVRFFSGRWVVSNGDCFQVLTFRACGANRKTLTPPYGEKNERSGAEGRVIDRALALVCGG